MPQSNEEKTSRSALDDLQHRIDAAKPVESPSEQKDDKFGMAEVGWRMVTELVAGIMLGAGLGYGIDQLAGVSPFGIIIGVLFGSAAGVRVMLNTAKSLDQNKNE